MQPAVAAEVFREGHQLAPNADAPLFGIGGQEAELARDLGEHLDADGAGEPVVDVRHDDLAGFDQVGHLGGGGAGRAASPEPVLGGLVDVVDERGQAVDQTGVAGGRGVQELNFDRPAHSSRVSRTIERCNT